MKFYNIIIFSILLFFISSVGSIAYAQTGLLSPYSSAGLFGIEMSYLNSRSAGMGGTVMGLAGSGSANPFNPASYRLGVDTMSVAFHVGMNLGLVSLKQERDGNMIKNQGTTGGLSNLEFYFPVFKWWKMGVFLLPVTEVAYASSSFNDERMDTAHIGRTQLIHTGSGGLNRVGWGNAFGWGPISVGLNLNYVFGRVEELDRLGFLTDTLAMYASETYYSRAVSYNGLGIDAGLQYVQPLGSKGRLIVGASYSMSALLKGKSTAIITGEGMSSSSTYVDTVRVYSAENINASYPSVLRTGIAYEQYGKFLLGADFSCSWWSEQAGQMPPLATYRASLGAEMLSDLRSNFWMRRLSYRIGANWQTYNYEYKGKQVSGFGISAGIGIPIRKSRSNIYVFGEYSRMGSLSAGQIEQNTGRIGISFSSVETWFVKRKYD
ncbi:MAG: hypothetical protein LBC49_04560 [Bacteroidales bacterium]|jgi:hypothetical protein|nr:hypothetical protein [Bacteroidales bacterium]